MTSPTPFSPLAHRTKRGRAGSLAKPDLIPNGMAAEVRNWIFEIGAKRQVTSHSPTPGSLMFSPTRPTQGETDTGASQINSRERHYLTTKVASVKNTLCSDEDQRSHPNNYTASAGHPAPFILATPCRQGPGLGHPLADEILLFNPPLRVAARSTVPGFLSLKEGDCIGVRKGLVWEVEMDTTVTGVIPVGEGNADTAEEVAHTCLVGVEWDILD
ncbi:hypothetical protein FQN49_003270 [Arthroderma sp. PD_2]|nr:hypothetical protein FQN49_003270 [Arthroderma sp. PD_2]